MVSISHNYFVASRSEYVVTNYCGDVNKEMNVTLLIMKNRGSFAKHRSVDILDTAKSQLK